MIKVVLCYFFILVDRFVAVQLKERHHKYSKYQWRKSHHSEYQWKREKDMKKTWKAQNITVKKTHNTENISEWSQQAIDKYHCWAEFSRPTIWFVFFAPDTRRSFISFSIHWCSSIVRRPHITHTHTHTRPVYNHTVILVRSVPWWLCCATTPEYMCWESLVGSWCLCWCVWTTRWPVHTESMGTPVHRVHDTR